MRYYKFKRLNLYIMPNQKSTPKEEATIADIYEFTPDPKNANKGTQRGLKLLQESLSSLGVGRSILLDRNKKIIAGNKTAESAASLGITRALVIPTDGKKLVAVQRTDLDLTKDLEARRLALLDNRVGEMDLSWDAERLIEDKPQAEGLWTEEEWTQIESQAIAQAISTPGQADPEKGMVTCPCCGERFNRYGAH